MDKHNSSPITRVHRKAGEAVPADQTATPGQLKMVVTYLEMRLPRTYGRAASRSENLSIIKAYKPHVGFYRYLYNAVGADWLWYERNQLSDSELLRIIHHDAVDLYVLYLNGAPAGFGELDFRTSNEVELAYFGLLPTYIGRGLGGYFLRHLVTAGWAKKPDRIWVHTCNFDAPNALSVYQVAGFSPYRQEVKMIQDPRKQQT